MPEKPIRTFRHSAGFGKRIEYWVIGNMIMHGLDVYVPIVDDDAIDAVIKRMDGSFIAVQIKARSNTVKFGDAALFAAIPHEYRSNYWFIFYSERMETTWIMTSEEFIKESVQNKTGNNIGKRSIWLNGHNTKNRTEHCKPQYMKYIATNFDRLKGE